MLYLSRMNPVVWIGLGGAIGSVFRYLLSHWVGVRETNQFPWHTFTVNLIGCFAIGFIWALLNKHAADRSFYFFLITGVLGGFTTFSSFGLETFHLIQAKEYLTATTYVLLSNAAGLLVVFLGYKLSGV